ncbi:MAG: site-2 protease family protein [Acidobacteriia bacterium]|nr:site-2 protease family protein [Terriglobia bacterium]
MQAQIKLGRIAGIAVGLHYSWFIIALLITLSLAGHFHSVTPQWSSSVVWASAIITSLCFFAALLMHELAHSLVAKAHGMRVQAITLFALGGISQIESDVPDAKTEFWMAIAGPITSTIIGCVFLGIAFWSGWRPRAAPAQPAVAVCLWLGYINLVLAAFNMIPGFPLDGGRILRAVVWRITSNADGSMRVAAKAGEAVAFAFIVLGLMRFFVGASFGGLWWAFIGWFLLDASRTSYAQTELLAELRDRRVGEMMERDCPTVDGTSSLQEFVDRYLLPTGGRCFIVEQGDQVVGLITPNEVKGVERALWPSRRVDSVMRPLQELHVVTPDTPAIQALQMMSREDVNQLPVVSNGRLEGIFSRRHVLRFLQIRGELLR